MFSTGKHQKLSTYPQGRKDQTGPVGLKLFGVLHGNYLLKIGETEQAHSSAKLLIKAQDCQQYYQAAGVAGPLN